MKGILEIEIIIEVSCSLSIDCTKALFIFIKIKYLSTEYLQVIYLLLN